MAAVIVRLDLVEPHRLRYAWNLVQGSRVIPKFGEIGQATAITFEVTVIDDVKANERREQTPVRFGDAVAYQERTARKPVLKSVIANRRSNASSYAACVVAKPAR